MIDRRTPIVVGSGQITDTTGMPSSEQLGRIVTVGPKGGRNVFVPSG